MKLNDLQQPVALAWTRPPQASAVGVLEEKYCGAPDCGYGGSCG